PRLDRLAGRDVEKFDKEIVGVEVHTRMRPALTCDRADQRLAAMVEQLDPEGRLELRPQRRRQRLGGREADALVQVAPRIPAELARLVREPAEEARRAGV